MEHILIALEEEWMKLISYSPRILAASIILIVSYYLGKYFSKIVILAIQRTSLSHLHHTYIKFISTFLVFFLGLIVALNVLNLEAVAVSLLAGGGITAVVLGFAFREIGENFLAGLFLAMSRPFNIDDFIKTEDIEGEVRDIQLRYTHLRTDDGRDVYVPSSQLFNKALTNFTKDGLRRISFSVGIDYSNDSLAATKLLSESIKGIEGVLKEPTSDAYILTLAPQYVEIMVYFWVDYFNKSVPVLDIRNQVMNTCRLSLLENGYIVSSETTSNILLTRQK
jgi:small-conductance mechanosensitive channel